MRDNQSTGGSGRARRRAATRRDPLDWAIDPPSVSHFIERVRERLGGAPTPAELERGYAAALIKHVGEHKPTGRGRQWFDIFTFLHRGAISRIRDDTLRWTVLAEIALKRDEFNGKIRDGETQA